MAATIALVDDDRNILTSVAIALEAEGFAVDTYADGEEALAGLNHKPADLVILDIKMPRMDGYELLSRLRKTSETPAIFLTSKDDEIDEVLGLKMGADDYIRKPFSQRLLVERIRAVLRRADSGSSKDGNSDGGDTLIARGPLSMDPVRHACTWHDRAVRLTVTEFLILQALANRPGHVKSRDQLMDAAYDGSVHVSDRTIDSHIRNIRKKFSEVDETVDLIGTVQGLGYKLKI